MVTRKKNKRPERKWTPELKKLAVKTLHMLLVSDFAGTCGGFLKKEQ